MAVYIENLNIDQFRGVKNLKINSLGDINILVGNNNSGKTSILEAIKLLQYPDDISSLCRVAFSRGPISKSIILEFVSSMFAKTPSDANNGKNMYMINLGATVNNKKIAVEIVGEIIEKLFIPNDTENMELSLLEEGKITAKRFTGTIKLSKDSDKAHYIQFELDENFNRDVGIGEQLYNCIYIHSNILIYKSCVTYLSDAIINDKKDDILTLLKIFDKNIYDVTAIESNIWLHDKVKGTMPLFTYGTGMQKALLLAAVFVQTRNGIVLIDEVDNAINISALEEVFTWLIKACKRMNIQAFLTTHSLEALDTMLKINNDLSKHDSLRVVTLKKQEGITLSRVLTGKQAYTSREDFNMELR